MPVSARKSRGTRFPYEFYGARSNAIFLIHNKTDPAFAESVVSKSYQFEFSVIKIVDFQGFFEREIIPTRCSYLIILTIHIIIAVRWMFIKILSVVINDREWFKVIVPGFVTLL